MPEMFKSFVFIFIILSQIKIIQSLIVSVGDYSNERIPGLNSPECGLGLEPTIVLELSLNNDCFQRKYKDRTLIFFDKPGVKHQISNRVFKGVDVRHAYESPWAVHLTITKSYGDVSTCTGVLITPYWVLTAAHCFEKWRDSWKAGVELNMGSNKRQGIHTAHIEPDSFHSHPLFHNPIGSSDEERHLSKFHNDIALVRVGGFIPESTLNHRYFINTICLPKRDQVNNYKENATFYGYGYINDKEEDPEYLQMGRIELSPFSLCNTLLCGVFSGDLPRICYGDSGGPLVQFVPGVKDRAVLLGITQSVAPENPPCSKEIISGFFVPVSQHIDWILKTMKENFD